MLTHKTNIRPRYNEVDQMGYVYHGNYIAYFHQARTELMRTLNLEDTAIEKLGYMMPVIDVHVKYKQPVGYDEPLTIITKVKELQKTRITFSFEVLNSIDKKVTLGQTTIVFVDKTSRKPIRIPEFVANALEKEFAPTQV